MNFAPFKNSYFSSQISISCICGLTNNPSMSEMKQCTTCQNYQHLKCIHKLSKINRFYECPACQFKNLDPGIEIVDTLVSPSLISYNDLTNGQSKRLLKFLHKQENYSRYKEMISQGKTPYISIRCLRLDEDGYEHHWPLNCKMTLNRKNILELKQLKYPPMSKPREDWPLIFSYDNSKFNDKSKHFSLKDILNENTIEFESNYKENDLDDFSYALAIHIIRPLAKGTIITRTESVKDKERLINLLGDNAHHSNNLISSEKVSLLDPYSSNSQITSPARSVFCQHAGVFDLDSFLTLNSKCKKWNCPRCGKKATRLYIDNFLLDFMGKNKGLNEVNFNFNDFSYSIISGDELKSKKEIEIIDLELEDVIETSLKNKNISQKGQMTNNSVSCKVENNNYITSNNKEVLPVIDLNNLLFSSITKNSPLNPTPNQSNPKQNEIRLSDNSKGLSKPDNIYSQSDSNKQISVEQNKTSTEKSSKNEIVNNNSVSDQKNNENKNTTTNKIDLLNLNDIPSKGNKITEKREFSISNQNDLNIKSNNLRFSCNKLLKTKDSNFTLRKENKQQKLIIDKEESFTYKNPNDEKREFEEKINNKFSAFYESLIERDEELRKLNDYFLSKKRNNENS